MEIQSATQAAFQQLRLQQAQRTAERAEQVARALRVEASAARREAERAQENARDLTVRSDQADGEAGRARQGVAMIGSLGAMQESLSLVLDRAGGAAATVLRVPPAAPQAPVINTSGQVTGTVINTAA